MHPLYFTLRIYPPFLVLSYYSKGHTSLWTSPSTSEPSKLRSFRTNASNLPGDPSRSQLPSSWESSSTPDSELVSYLPTSSSCSSSLSTLQSKLGASEGIHIPSPFLLWFSSTRERGVSGGQNPQRTRLSATARRTVIIDQRIGAAKE